MGKVQKALIIAVLLMWLIQAALGIVTKFMSAGEFDAEHKRLLALKEEVGRLESAMGAAGDKARAPDGIRADLSRLASEIEGLLDREVRGHRWRWWDDVFKLLLVLVLLALVSKARFAPSVGQLETDSTGSRQ